MDWIFSPPFPYHGTAHASSLTHSFKLYHFPSQLLSQAIPAIITVQMQCSLDTLLYLIKHLFLRRKAAGFTDRPDAFPRENMMARESASARAQSVSAQPAPEDAPPSFLFHLNHLHPPSLPPNNGPAFNSYHRALWHPASYLAGR